MKDSVLLADIGNSALKSIKWKPAQKNFIGVPRRIDWSDFDSKDSASQSRLLRDSIEGNPTKVYLSSVNPGRSHQFGAMLQDFAAVKLVEISNRDVPMKIELDAPEKLGIDRLLAAFAAWQLFGTQEPLIVLQVGTAVTIDLVRADGSYQGGAILPSEATLYRSLAEKTAQLPLLQPEPDGLGLDALAPGEIMKDESSTGKVVKLLPPGKNTSQALRIGISNCVLGGVERTYRSYCELVGRELQVIATGGGVGHMVRELPLPIIPVANLVLKGLSLIAR